MTALAVRSVIQALPSTSMTIWRGPCRNVEVMTATGSGELSVARDASCAALNSYSAGVGVPLMLALESTTHRLPMGSNATPSGAPKISLLIDTCGVTEPVAPCNWPGLYSITRVPFATQRPLLPTGALSSAGKLQAASNAQPRRSTGDRIAIFHNIDGKLIARPRNSRKVT